MVVGRCSFLLKNMRNGFLERLCMSWALKDEEAFTEQTQTFLIEGTKVAKNGIA